MTQDRHDPNAQGGNPPIQLELNPATPLITTILRLARKLEARQSRVFTRFNLTGPQYQVLALLHESENPGLQQIELSNRLFVSKPNITGMVQRLERAGLIERKQGSDARAKVVSLTNLGRQAVEDVTTPLASLNAELMNFMSINAQQDLLQVLGFIIDSTDGLTPRRLEQLSDGDGRRP